MSLWWCYHNFFFFFKQKTAYEMRISDWSSDVCSSDLTGDGVPELKATLSALMPEGHWHFPEDEVSDAPERMLAAEITREQLSRQLHEELPYQSTVETENFTTHPAGRAAIHQQILVARDNQRAIILAHTGARKTGRTP